MLSDGSMALFNEIYVEPVAYKRSDEKRMEDKRRGGKRGIEWADWESYGNWPRQSIVTL